MNYATADEFRQKEKIRKQEENIPNNDFHKKTNKENDIHTQKISKELEEKTIWKLEIFGCRINVRKISLLCLGHSNTVRNYSLGQNLYLLSPINI